MIVVAAMIEIGLANLILTEDCNVGTRGWPALCIDVRNDATTVGEHDVDGRLTQIWLRRFIDVPRIMNCCDRTIEPQIGRSVSS